MNEPAFPSHGSMGEVAQQGMTLRDYFAAKAMQAKLSYGDAGYDDVAKRAYKYADAMMEARNVAQ
jgi:hypothetical protein